MNRILPSSAVIRKQVFDFSTDARKIVDSSLAAAAVSSLFGEIYEASLAVNTVLKGLSRRNMRPRLHPAQTVATRVPLLVGIGQASVAEAEMRRFVEILLWAVYFTDHPVEWRKFSDKNVGGFSHDIRRPITYAAHRELGFYIEYALELMSEEPSGLGTKAIEELKQSVRVLNAAVHAGDLARTVTRFPAHETVSDGALKDFARIQRRTFAACALLLAAYDRSKFDQLSAMGRGYFDWLVGAKFRKEVRKGPFGLD